MGLKTLYRRLQRGYTEGMKRLFLAAAVALAVSPACAAEFGADLQSIKDSLSALKNKQAPAKVDQAPVDKLFDRLAKDGPTYARSEATQDGGQRTLQVTLVEVEGPQQEGMYRDLVYRRYFSHIQGVEQYIRPNADGKTGTLEQYVYKVSLDGKLQEVKHVTMAILGATPDGLVIDKKSMHQDSMSPSAAETQQRWKKLSAEFLRLGRTYEV